MTTEQAKSEWETFLEALMSAIESSELGAEEEIEIAAMLLAKHGLRPSQAE